MDGEIKSFIKVWLAAMASLCYCYFVAARIPKGVARLISILPIIYLFIILHFSLSSFHLGAPTVFYLVWLANSKLLLFSFNHGPLSSPQPISLLHFTSIALLPIKTKRDPSPHQNQTKSNRSSAKPNIFLLAIKVVLLAAIAKFAYKCTHGSSLLPIAQLYLGAELMLAISAFLVRALLGLEPEQQFNEPYLATYLASRLLGAQVEPCSDKYSAPGRVRSVAIYGGTAASLFRNLSGVRPDARDTLFLSDSCQSNLGGDMFFCAPWGLYRGRGCCQEGVDWQLAVAQGGLGTTHGGVCGGDRCLAILAAGDEEWCGSKGHKGVLRISMLC
ncbi:hypothetical protein RJ640_004785 [Escallonia rubra]|uniref:Uncharacterized protein n=1 Tax=Escallonia rubra TaxID=112253 RepID=A0AA88UJ94_9ASTE|nr:hypothetical protein RJ640_004785 [Escallonia rubra]